MTVADSVPRKRLRLCRRPFTKAATNLEDMPPNSTFSDSANETPEKLKNEQVKSVEQTGANDNLVDAVDQVLENKLTSAAFHTLSKISGLGNIGNSCFLNSVLQVLRHTPGFSLNLQNLCVAMKEKESVCGVVKMENCVSENVSHETCSTRTPAWTLPEQLLELFADMERAESQNGASPAVYPRNLLSSLRYLSPQYEGNLQHDVQELLHCILGHLQNTVDQITGNFSFSESELNCGDYSEVNHSSSNSTMSAAPSYQKGSSGKSITKNCSPHKKSDHLNKLAQSVSSSQSSPKCDVSLLCTRPNQTKEPSTSVAAKSGASTRKCTVMIEKLSSENASPGCSSEELETCAKDSVTRTSYSRKRSKPMLACSAQPKCKSSRLLTNSSSCSDIVDSIDQWNLGETTVSSVKSVNGNFVQDLFHGQMLFRTRCAECESYSERREAFQEIGVPVQSGPDKCDADNDEDNIMPEQSEWIASAMHQVETLRDDCKYYCNTCLRYCEAERFVHYEKVPQSLTVQLKRFSSSGGLFGGVSKLNNFVATPLLLPCLQYSCATAGNYLHTNCQHQFELYAVIMHQGCSLSAGHYIVYIRAPADGSKPTVNERKCEQPAGPHSPMIADVPVSDQLVPSFVYSQTPEKSRSETQNGDGDCAEANFTNGLLHCEQGDAVTSLEDINTNSGESSNRDGVCETLWYECDDDHVNEVTLKELNRILSREGTGSMTPYLLFYVKTGKT